MTLSKLSSTAMILAAGLGTRLRPLTLTKPKPLFEVAGRTMLDATLDRLVEIGIERAVVNTFYLADQIEDHLRNRADIGIVISHETELLDTGGGIVKALPLLGDKPFITLNADLPWRDEGTPSLKRMIQTWDANTMDALLLMMRAEKARGFAPPGQTPPGDFALEPNGRLWRKNLQPPRPFVWIGTQIIKPECYAHPPARSFSNNRVWDKIESRNALRGLEHLGACYHVGTPEDWRMANDLWASGKGWGP